MQSLPVSCEAIRVFCGFKKSDLDRQTFFKGVGQTFMPGTPYMLQPLGLAAYLPGVLAAPPAGLPDEFALICYPSAAVWDRCMHETLRGRVYNQSHGGVYASTSGAAFPKRLADMSGGAVGPFYVFDRDIDWQQGDTQVVVAPRGTMQTDGTTFRLALHERMRANMALFSGQGFDQIIATATDAFCILWFHSEGHVAAPELASLDGVLGTRMIMRNERVICVDEPPAVTLDGDRAFNFIFIRDERYFLS